MIQQQVQQLLAEWREAERQLEQTSDPAHAHALRARVDELRDAYQRTIAAAHTPSDPATPN